MLRRIVICTGSRMTKPWPYGCCTFSHSGATNSSPPWLKAVLKLKGFAKSSSDDIVNWRATMINLENAGCHSYQVLESPGILTLTEDDLFKRMDILQQLHIDAISIPLIVLANHRYGEIIARCDNYMTRTKGCVSVADFWRKVFQCSKEDMAELLLSNPRLLKGARGLDGRFQKAQYLLLSGAKHSDLRKSSHCLVNVPHETLNRRVEELMAHDVHPLPICLLGQAEHLYQRALRNILAKKQPYDTRFEVLKDLLGVDENTLTDHVYRRTSISRLKARIEYLLHVRGYDPENIINSPAIIDRVEVSRLEQAFHELDEAGLEDLQLSTVVSYLNNKKLPAFRKGSQSSFAKKLGFNTHDMADTSHGDFAGLFQQNSSVVQKNFRYLNEKCGFHTQTILDVPVILGHDHDLLVEHWKELPKDKKDLFRKWKNAEWKLLNLLQYDIEKSVNFKHSVLISNVKS